MWPVSRSGGGARGLSKAPRADGFVVRDLDREALSI